MVVVEIENEIYGYGKTGYRVENRTGPPNFRGPQNIISILDIVI